jgi:hypothetical protein
MRMSLFFVISGKRLVKGSKIDNKHKPNYDKYGLLDIYTSYERRE